MTTSTCNIDICSLQIVSVCVPFLFKYAVDNLNEYHSVAETVTKAGNSATIILALLVGCKIFLYV